MYDSLARRRSALNNQTDKIKIIYLYRYLSLIITSVFYLISNSNHPIEKKIMIIGCISASSIIINYLYVKNTEIKLNMIVLVLIEIVGNSFILIPSGGLNSPYIWYSLNTILVTAVELDKKYCWANLFIYVFSCIYISFMFFGDKTENFLTLIRGELNPILSLVLITILVQLLAKYMKKIEFKSVKLTENNEQLSSVNRQIKESMNYTVELYEALHLLTNERDKQKLIETIILYTQKITKTDTAFFYYNKSGIKQITFDENYADSEERKKIEDKLEEIYNLMSEENTYRQTIVNNKEFVLVPIKSDCICYGVLGIEAMQNKVGNYNETIDELMLLSELSSIAFKGFELEKANERLIVSEEQNRIANEIHDSVLQRLFSISCGIYSICKRLKTTSTDSAKMELNTIRDSINTTMNELRAAVYGLSWTKDGTNNFVVDISNYINEVKSLNNIDISFNLSGNSEQLNLLQKKYLHRIIFEAVGNAIRHGRANNIKVVLQIKRNTTLLDIIDDGSGFDFYYIDKSNKKGLGIQNIKNLVFTLNGEINFDTGIGKGTNIKIIIPVKGFSSMEGEVV